MSVLWIDYGYINRGSSYTTISIHTAVCRGYSGYVRRGGAICFLALRISKKTLWRYDIHTVFSGNGIGVLYSVLLAAWLVVCVEFGVKVA